jgi:hypothetical protein
MKEIIQYVGFCVWFLSLSILYLMLIHVIFMPIMSYFGISNFLKSVYKLMSTWVIYIMSNASVNIHAYVLKWSCFHFFWIHIDTSRIDESHSSAV